MPATKRYHTEEAMRAALASLAHNFSAASLKKGDDHPQEVLEAVIAEVIERRATWQEFRNTLARWVNQFNAR